MEDDSDERSLLTALSVPCPSQGRDSILMGHSPSLSGSHPPAEHFLTRPSLLASGTQGLSCGRRPGGPRVRRARRRAADPEVDRPRPLLPHTTLFPAYLTNLALSIFKFCWGRKMGLLQISYKEHLQGKFSHKETVRNLNKDRLFSAL